MLAAEIGILVLPFVLGFMAGYGTREYISHQRRKHAGRL
jgi:hypothetical protein